MKRSFRQLLSLAIALVLVLSVPVQAFAGECEHTFLDGVCTICGVAEVPVEEAVEEAAEEPAEEPVVEEPAEEPVQEPVVEEPAEEPVQEPVVEEPAEEPVQEPAVVEADVELAEGSLDGGDIDLGETPAAALTLKAKVTPSAATTADQPEDIDIILSVWDEENNRVNVLNTSYVIFNAAGQEVTLAEALRTPDTYTVMPTYQEDDQYDVTVESATLVVSEVAYACVNDATGVQYESLKEALDEAVSGQTVRLTCDWTEAADFTLNTGVTLDLDVYTLTVEGRIIGLQGSYLDGTAYRTNGNPYAKLIAKKGLYMLTDNSFVDSAGYNIVPMYQDDGYVFGRFAVNTDASKNRGLKVDTTNKELYFQFVTQTTSAVRTNLMTDGIADNDMTIIVRLLWDAGNGLAYQDYEYKDDFVKIVAGGNADYTFTLTGYDKLGINPDKLTVKAMIVTDCGIDALGVEWGSWTE